jgi:PTH1 family peptidyl-tRNA hydrolase
MVSEPWGRPESFSYLCPKISQRMKYLITGLGNIGPEYQGTRHNIGFDVVDTLAREFEVSFKTESLGDVAEFRFKGRTFVLLKPSTYMNRSGKSVRYWLQKKKIEPANLLVVLDDLNLPLGKLRLRTQGSHGGHNGLRDIDEMLGNNQYARLRLGIGNDFPKGRQADFVLSPWTMAELEVVPTVLKQAAETVKVFGTSGPAMAMNLFNK